MKKHIALLVAILIVLSFSAFIPIGNAYYFNSIAIAKFQGYNGDGSFVEYPAYGGSCFGYVLGILPAALCSEPERIMNSDQASDRLGTNIIEGCSKTFGCTFGAIPYGLKKAFWDFPIWLFSGPSNKNSSYYDYKPLPPPVVQIDPRLLTKEEKINLNVKTNITEPPLIKIKTEAPIPAVSTVGSLPETKEAKTPSLIVVPTGNSIPVAPANIPTTNSGNNTSTSSQNNTNEQTQEQTNNSQQWESSQNLPNWVSEKASK